MRIVKVFWVESCGKSEVWFVEAGDCLSWCTDRPGAIDLLEGRWTDEWVDEGPSQPYEIVWAGVNRDVLHVYHPYGELVWVVDAVAVRKLYPSPPYIRA